jgi:chromosome segregation ATPase
MARTAREIAISYSFGFNSRIGDINAVLMYYGYKRLPDHIAEAIEELKAVRKEAGELAKRLSELKGMERRNRGWLPSHSECCDDEYQEGLELSWEIRDIEDHMSELNSKIDQLKAIAKL